jgi:hypothetical protein
MAMAAAGSPVSVSAEKPYTLEQLQLIQELFIDQTEGPLTPLKKLIDGEIKLLNPEGSNDAKLVIPSAPPPDDVPSKDTAVAGAGAEMCAAGAGASSDTLVKAGAGGDKDIVAKAISAASLIVASPAFMAAFKTTINEIDKNKEGQIKESGFFGPWYQKEVIKPALTPEQGLRVAFILKNHHRKLLTRGIINLIQKIKGPLQIIELKKIFSAYDGIQLFFMTCVYAEEPSNQQQADARLEIIYAYINIMEATHQGILDRSLSYVVNGEGDNVLGVFLKHEIFRGDRVYRDNTAEKYYEEQSIKFDYYLKILVYVFKVRPTLSIEASKLRLNGKYDFLTILVWLLKNKGYRIEKGYAEFCDKNYYYYSYTAYNHTKKKVLILIYRLLEEYIGIKSEKLHIIESVESGSYFRISLALKEWYIDLLKSAILNNQEAEIKKLLKFYLEEPESSLFKSFDCPIDGIREDNAGILSWAIQANNSLILNGGFVSQLEQRYRRGALPSYVMQWTDAVAKALSAFNVSVYQFLVNSSSLDLKKDFRLIHIQYLVNTAPDASGRDNQKLLAFIKAILYANKNKHPSERGIGKIIYPKDFLWDLILKNNSQSRFLLALLLRIGKCKAEDIESLKMAANSRESEGLFDKTVEELEVIINESLPEGASLDFEDPESMLATPTAPPTENPRAYDAAGGAGAGASAAPVSAPPTAPTASLATIIDDPAPAAAEEERNDITTAAAEPDPGADVTVSASVVCPAAVTPLETALAKAFNALKTQLEKFSGELISLAEQDAGYQNAHNLYIKLKISLGLPVEAAVSANEEIADLKMLIEETKKTIESTIQLIGDGTILDASTTSREEDIARINERLSGIRIRVNEQNARLLAWKEALSAPTARVADARVAAGASAGVAATFRTENSVMSAEANRDARSPLLH